MNDRAFVSTSDNSARSVVGALCLSHEPSNGKLKPWAAPILLLGGLLVGSAQAESPPDAPADQPKVGKVSLQAIQPDAGRVRIEKLSSESEQPKAAGRIKLSILSELPAESVTAGHVRLQTLSPVPADEDVTDVELPAWAAAPAPHPPAEISEPVFESNAELKTARQVPLPNLRGGEWRQADSGGDFQADRTLAPERSELKFDAGSVVRSAISRTQSAPTLPAEPVAEHQPRADTVDAADFIASETVTVDRTISDEELARFGQFIASLTRHSQVDDEALPLPPKSDTQGYQPLFPRLSQTTTNIRLKDLSADEADETGAPPRDPVKPEQIKEWFENQDRIHYGLSDPAMWLQGTSANYQQPFYHRPLYFENPRVERCGDTYGFIEPVASSVHFCTSVLLFPIRIYMLGIDPNMLVYATEEDSCP